MKKQHYIICIAIVAMLSGGSLYYYDSRTPTHLRYSTNSLYHFTTFNRGLFSGPVAGLAGVEFFETRIGATGVVERTPHPILTAVTMDEEKRIACFTVREARFHDGSALTVEDILYSLHLPQTYPSHIRKNYTIADYHFHHEGGRRFCLESDNPGGAPYALSNAITAERFVLQRKAGGGVIGLGPYKVVSERDGPGGRELELAPNNDFCCGTPLLERVTINFRKDDDGGSAADKIYYDWRKGAIDGSSSLGRVYTEALRERGVATLIPPGSDVYTLRFNCARPHLKKWQARAGLMELVGRNRGRLADALDEGGAPFLMVDRPTLAPSHVVERVRRDPMELFQQAGWVMREGTLVDENTGDPFSLTIGYYQNDRFLPALDVLVKRFREEGLRVVTKSYTRPVAPYYAWRGGELDAVFTPARSSRSMVTLSYLSDGEANFSHYADREFDRLVKEEEWEKAMKRLIERAPAIFLFIDTSQGLLAREGAWERLLAGCPFYLECLYK